MELNTINYGEREKDISVKMKRSTMEVSLTAFGSSFFKL